MSVGAILYYLDHFVVGRLARYTYGLPGSVGYNSSDPEHRKRAYKKIQAIPGTGIYMLDIFRPTLLKVDVSAPGLRTRD